MMSQGKRFIAVATCALLASSCATDPVVQVRPVGLAARGAAGSDDLALGQAALALGNVGTALQQFRQVLRIHPQSTSALTGIANCYDAMGRTDLSRRYFQEALALTPADTHLLQLYAASLARQGAVAEAQAVIAEIALRNRAPAAQWVVEAAPAPPAVEPAQPAASVEPSAPAQPVAVAQAVPLVEPLAPVEMAAPVRPPPRPAVPVSFAGTVPPPRPAATVPPPQPLARPAIIAASVTPAVAASPKPRLERISLGEIALVTSGKPLWRALVARFVEPRPVAIAGTAPRMVRLLNAARLQGLAARRAAQLHGAGWRQLAIGNAPRTRQASLILYPIGQRIAARRLGASLRIAALRATTRSDFLVLLGRDSG